MNKYHNSSCEAVYQWYSMTDSIEKNINAVFSDHIPLINIAGEIICDDKNEFISYPLDRGEQVEKFNYIVKSDNKKKACIVTSGETALELGSPKHSSIPTLLWTKEDGILKNRIWISGRELNEIKSTPVSFLMVVMVRIGKNFDPSGPNFQTLMNLSNRIPGYMSRSVPGKLWVRIGKDLMKKNFSLYSLGQCLAYSFYETVPDIGGIDIILAADNDSLTRKFENINIRARAISGLNRKLSIEMDGTLTCEDLDCELCDEKASCDTIREILQIRRKRQ